MKTKQIALVLALVLGFAGSAFSAAVTHGVKNTKHNLGATGPLGRHYTSTVDQVCVFCHTPHNANQSYALWNKYMPGSTTFKMYSSSFRSAAVKGATLPTGSESLLCLSCHDGKTAMNVLHSVSDNLGSAGGSFGAGDVFVNMNGSGASPVIMEDASYSVFGGYVPGNLGGDPGSTSDLSNDHPIGFSYTLARSQNAVGDYNDISSSKLKLFGASRDRLECSTCHDPHVDYNTTTAGAGADAYRPFLRISNAGSAMCLTCHNK